MPYGEDVTPPITILEGLVKQKNLRNRVSYTMTLPLASTPSSYHAASYYSYDVHGNVDTLVQQYKGIPEMTGSSNEFKLIAYDYDLISGKVNNVHYQPGKTDAFYHRYGYDMDNRLTGVETSRDRIYWEQDAAYSYYKHGPLSRTVLGQQQVQGMDYAYTLQGWLKGVNSTNLLAASDMGRDGLSSGNSKVGRDLVGYSLHYYDSLDTVNKWMDYKAIAGVSAFARPGVSSGFVPLYNGNIGAMSVNNAGLLKGAAASTNALPLFYNYRYDQLNRLVSMQAYKGLDAATNKWTAVSIDDYKEAVSYDPNGNILTYNRNGSPSIGTSQRLMDSLLYQYYYYDPTNNRKSYDPLQGLPGDVGRLTNQLAHVDDRMVNSAAYSQDLDDQAVNNYSYDAIGNLKGDAAEGITAINWNVYGKITSIVKNGSTISYSYDASGNRISKTVGGITTVYVRDASGNVMSVYQGTASTLKQTENHLYGSGRLGIQGEQTLMPLVVALQGGYGSASVSVFTRGEKSYELSNHLGNVLATISDRKLQHDGGSGIVDYYTADVISAQDYYPGGMLLPGRTYQAASKSYRYGFNTHEKSDEISGIGNHTTALYGEYDARLIRRWNPDPKPTDGVSMYTVFLNNPIWRNDILLDTPSTKEAALMADNSYSKFDPNNKTQLALKKMGWKRIEKIKTNLFGKTNQEVSLDEIGAVSGYNMALYSKTLNGKTEWVLANAGTNDLIDVGSDARNLNGSSEQYAFSVRFAKSLQNGMGGQEMTYVGHSLGGGLAAANSLATGNPAITFNPAGVSWATRIANNLPKDKRNGQILSFVVGGEAIDRSQRWVGSKANGQITYINPVLGKIDSRTALYLRWSTEVMTSIQYHMMSTVIQSLDKAGIK